MDAADQSLDDPTSQAKTLGGIGSILMLLTVVPAVGWVLACVGAILTLIAVKYVSDAVGDASIFRNMIIAVILSVVGLVVGVLVILTTVFTAMGLGMFAGGIGATPFVPPSAATGGFMGMIVGAISGLAVIWVLFLVSAIFVRRSYSSMSSKLGVRMFDTAGLLYLVGAALTIVLVGFVLILVALVLNIVAFFSIPDQPMQPQQPMPPPQM